MTDERVAELLREHELPDEAGAQERAWRVVSAAAAEARPPTRQRMRGRVALALAAAGIAVALALTPPGAAVADWVHDAVDPGRKDARPALDSLPAPGRLLVVSTKGPWIVERNGSMRRLGDYDEAGWSPNGLFVVATRGRQLVALDPKGAIRWSLARPHPMRAPEWSQDGFRIVYLSGGSLRVVAGDGTGDRLVAPGAGSVAPVWRPGREHAVAFADPAGRITVADTDTGRREWRTRPGPPPRRLAWTPDGTRLVALTDVSLRVLSADGRQLSELRLGPDGHPGALAVHPAGDTAAVALRDTDGRSEVVSFSLRGRLGSGRRLFAGQGRFTDLAWSPDGRWLLVAWREADQWLFVRSDRVRKVDAVSNIARQFDPAGHRPALFPRIGGWCCSR